MMDFIYQDDKSWLLAIQRKLYTWSRNNPSQGWHDMWNWVTQLPNLRLAWKRVASNQGAQTAGVDNMTVKRIRSKKGGVIHFLQQLRTELRSGAYCPTSVKRHWIPKVGKSSGIRPLGIPTVRINCTQVQSVFGIYYYYSSISPMERTTFSNIINKELQESGYI